VTNKFSSIKLINLVILSCRVYQLQDIFQPALRDVFDQGIGGNGSGAWGGGAGADEY
jgi:hypothetical protein